MLLKKDKCVTSWKERARNQPLNAMQRTPRPLAPSLSIDAIEHKMWIQLDKIIQNDQSNKLENILYFPAAHV